MKETLFPTIVLVFLRRRRINAFNYCTTTTTTITHLKLSVTLMNHRTIEQCLMIEESRANYIVIHYISQFCCLDYEMQHTFSLSQTRASVRNPHRLSKNQILVTKNLL